MTRDPLGMVDGPNVYTYVESSPASNFDPLGLVTEAQCYKNFDKCKRNACHTLVAYLEGLGLVGVGGSILTGVALAACLITWNPWVCAATAGLGLLDLLFLYDASDFYNRDIAICNSQLKTCLRRAKK